jgi:hypothetical protein
VAARQLSAPSWQFVQRLLIYTTHCLPETVGISLVGDVFIAVKIVAKTMGSRSAGNQRIKLVFKQPRSSGRKRRRRRLALILKG